MAENVGNITIEGEKSHVSSVLLQSDQRSLFSIHSNKDISSEFIASKFLIAPCESQILQFVEITEP